MTLTTSSFTIGSSDTLVYTAGAGTTEVILRLVNGAGARAYFFFIRAGLTNPVAQASVLNGVFTSVGSSLVSNGDNYNLTIQPGDEVHGITEGGYAVGSLTVLVL